MTTRYPAIMTLLRFAGWSLGALKRTFFGTGGIALLVIAGLYVAGAVVEPVRWYLIGFGSALLLLCGGVLAVSYARIMVDRFIEDRMTQEFSLFVARHAHELEKRARWRTLKDRYRGHRAFLIGNGPSLNRTPLHLLKGEFTLCFNRFDLMFERLAWRPTMYMCADERVAEDTAARINHIVPLVRYAFFPDIHPGPDRVDFRRFIADADNVFWLSLQWGESGGFHDDLPICGMGGTVTHAGLQVLAFMGFSPIYLVGVDMDYIDHRTAVKHDRRDWTSTQDDDPNHFDPRYFGAGARYHYPALREKMLPSLQQAGEHLDRKGVAVMNAGIGGSLEAFPRVGFRSLFDVDGDAELDMLLSAVPVELREQARNALQGDRVVDTCDDWDGDAPLQVTTLQLAGQLIAQAIFTHIPYGPVGNRYLFIGRDQVLDTPPEPTS